MSKCRAYRSFWRRLLPDWWIVRKRLAQLYVKEIPDISTLLDDIHELHEYHTRKELARQLQREYTEQLVLDENGELDRERTSAGFRASEQVDPLIIAFPESKEILVDPSRVDRDALNASLEELGSRYESFRKAVADASKHGDSKTVLNSDGSLAIESVNGFVKWLDELISTVLGRLADVDVLCRLLKPGCDVPIGEVPVRLASIATLRLPELRQPADHFVLRDDGELDRERTVAGLRASERVDPLVRVFPELKEILVEPSPVDRDALRTSLERLRSGYHDFRDAVAHTNKQFDLGAVFNADGGLSRMSLDEFAKWLDEQIFGLDERLGDVNALCLMLKRGCDVRLDDLPARLVSLAALPERTIGSLRIISYSKRMVS